MCSAASKVVPAPLSRRSSEFEPRAPLSFAATPSAAAGSSMGAGIGRIAFVDCRRAADGRARGTDAFPPLVNF